LFATGCINQTVKVWVTGTNRPLLPTLEHRDPVNALVFSKDRRWLLVGCARDEGRRTGEARLWPLPAPMDGDAEHVSAAVQLLTGLELNPRGVAKVLDAASWHQRNSQMTNSQ
jgi:hypothetical protein